MFFTLRNKTLGNTPPDGSYKVLTSTMFLVHKLELEGIQACSPVTMGRSETWFLVVKNFTTRTLPVTVSL